MAKHKGSKRRVMVRKAYPSGIEIADSPDPGPGTKAINPKGRKGQRNMKRGAADQPDAPHSDQLAGGKVSRQVARQALRLERKRLESEARKAAGKRRENRNGQGKGKDQG